MIIERLFNGNRNPTRLNGVMAAKNGHSKICHLIHKHLDKSCDYTINPPEDHNYTPFHYAAANGHLSICKFFIDTLSNRNPKCDFDSTPLHLATAKGHFEVCK